MPTASQYGQPLNRYSEHLPAFSYEPLAPGHIRLLQVVSSTNGYLDCFIEHVDLNSPGCTWMALSYVWGSEPANQHILLNEKFFSVRPNLLSALHALRRYQDTNAEDMPFFPDEENISRIWIDAVCIDQENEAEKAEQIPKMDIIYSKADMVLVWLGPPEQSTAYVFKVLERESISTAIFAWTDKIGKSLDEINAMLSPEVDSEGFDPSTPLAAIVEMRTAVERLMDRAKVLEAESNITHEQLTAFRALVLQSSQLSQQTGRLEGTELSTPWKDSEFLSRIIPLQHIFWRQFLMFWKNPWFYRVWTLQERHLGRRVKVLLEHSIINFLFLEQCGYILRDRELESRILAVWDTHAAQEDYITGLLTSNWPRLEIPNGLGICLTLTSLRNAAKKHDYVYGVLGLVEKSTSALLKVDYQSPPAVLFAKSLKLAITEPPVPMTLTYLWERFCLTRKVTPDLPTWCPDFSNANHREATFSGAPEPVVADVVREACQRFAFIDVGNLESRKLHVAALRLDVIDTCIPRCIDSRLTARDLEAASELGLTPEVVAPFFNAILKWLIAAAKVIASPATRYDFWEQIGKLVSAFSSHGELQVSTWELDSLQSFCRRLLDGTSVLFDQNADRRMYHYQRDMNLMKQLVSIHDALDRKFIFQTSTGKIGFCWRLIQPGDNVVYVPRGAHLHIISKCRKRYRGVGSVEGLMEANILSLPGKLEDRLDVFTLT
jgi:hypothetical protein